MSQCTIGGARRRAGNTEDRRNGVLRAAAFAPSQRSEAATDRLRVRMLDTDQLRFVTRWAACCGPAPGRPEYGPGARPKFGHPQGHGNRPAPDGGVCAVVDVHYLPAGGARAAAVLAADATFAHVLAERTATAPRVAPYRPGEFYRRELPPNARS